MSKFGFSYSAVCEGKVGDSKLWLLVAVSVQLLWFWLLVWNVWEEVEEVVIVLSDEQWLLLCW